MDPTVELGPDGFPLDPADPDVRYHRELSTWLEIQTAPGAPAAWRFDPPAEWPRWLRPALRRFAWVRAHAALLGDRKLDARIARFISLLVNRISLGKPERDQEDTFSELALQAAAIEGSGYGSLAARTCEGRHRSGDAPESALDVARAFVLRGPARPHVRAGLALVPGPV
jgi:hypothetical protein